MESPALSQTKKICPLTSIRFFAAALVVFHHSAQVFLPGIARKAWTQIRPGFPERALFSFTVSVSFFFLLSGYVLGCVYLRKHGAVDKKSFYIARFARIYPLYFVMLVIDTQQLLRVELQEHGFVIGLSKTAAIFAANLLIVQAWDTSRLSRINVPSWSLSAELFFYLCFPLIGELVWKLRGKWLLLATLMLYVGGQALVFSMRPHLGLQTLLTFPPFHCSTFALGIILARLQTLQAKGREGAEASFAQVTAAFWTSAVCIALSILLMPLFRVPAPYNNGLLTPAFAGIIWALSSAKTWISEWFCVRWLVVSGNASYALYLIHQPLLSLFVQFHWLSKQDYAVYLVLCLSLSVLSFYHFETPIRLWLSRWLRSRMVKSIEVTTSA